MTFGSLFEMAFLLLSLPGGESTAQCVKAGIGLLGASECVTCVSTLVLPRQL